VDIHPQATIGFCDGSSLQNRPNYHRMLDTPRWRYKQGSKRSQAFFGFLSINGKDCLCATPQAKATNFQDFLMQIRQTNRDGHPIGLILDNARIHKAKATRLLARKLNIHLLFLPPYSPHLNPIEFAWKDGKKELSRVADFDLAIQKAEQVFFHMIQSRKPSYSKNWIHKFIPSTC